MSARVHLRVQSGLTVGFLENGDWVFTVCTVGMENMLGRELHAGDDIIVDFSGEVVEDSDDDNAMTIRVQHRLLTGWLSKDTGKYVFTLDRRSISKLLNRRFKVNDLFQVLFRAKILENGLTTEM